MMHNLYYIIPAMIGSGLLYGLYAAIKYEINYFKEEKRKKS